MPGTWPKMGCACFYCSLAAWLEKSDKLTAASSAETIYTVCHKRKLDEALRSAGGHLFTCFVAEANHLLGYEVGRR